MEGQDWTSPPGLQLEHVQVFFRHGERTANEARLPKIGLPEVWPLARAGKCPDAFSHQGRSRAILLDDDIQTEPPAYTDTAGALAYCCRGELTTKGLDTTHELGLKLRSIYVDDLAFLPPTLDDPDTLYLRSTQYQRTFVSLQHVLRGLYPHDKRTVDPARLSVTVLSPQEETLLPPGDYCPRFKVLLDEFTCRAAAKWNNSPEMALVNKALGKWMPDGCAIAIDSKPWKLHGILDTIISAKSHAEMHKYLPPEFFDPEMEATMYRIIAEEEFSGYAYSLEFRELGIGKAFAEVAQRMVDMRSRPTASARFCLLSCHDSAIAAMLVSLGAMGDPDWFWPPFAAFVAFELYRGQPDGTTQREAWYTRVCYMGKPLKLRVALPDGNHFPGDETLCRLEVFKAMVDQWTPRGWTPST